MVNISLKSIGHVVSDFNSPEELQFACERGLMTKTSSTIVIMDEFKEGLKNLGDFSHVFVIYFLHKAEKTELTTYPGPKSVKGLPKVGVFASRSQYRPNPIALRLVKLLEIKENRIVVEGLDAIDGSKVLDIKPYIPGFDRPEIVKVASHYSWLEEKE